MPKSVTAVTAAHISMLIDSVQAVVGRAKPRLMGEGMRTIVWGRRRCTWSVEQESTQPDPFAWLFCVSAISWKGNGYREEGYSIHPFGGTWCNQYRQSRMMERRRKAVQRLRRWYCIRKGKKKSKIPDPVRTTVALIALFSERVLHCASWLSLVWMRVDWFSKIPLNLKLFFPRLNPTIGQVWTFDCKNRDCPK